MKKFKDFVEENYSYRSTSIDNSDGVIIPVKEEETEEYMFFSNLKAIKRQVDELLSIDSKLIIERLKNGHERAVDHIATSKDDVSEVYEFLINLK
mgnify:CR=1 FL=1